MSSEYVLKESHYLSFSCFLGFCVVFYVSVALTVSSGFIQQLILFKNYFYVYKCLPVHHICDWCLRRPEKNIRSPRIASTDGCEPPCECWELNSGPLEEQPVLLVPEPSLRL